MTVIEGTAPPELPVERELVELIVWERHRLDGSAPLKYRLLKQRPSRFDPAGPLAG